MPRPLTVIAEIEASTAEGKLNGLTVVELLIHGEHGRTARKKHSS